MSILQVAFKWTRRSAARARASRRRAAVGGLLGGLAGVAIAGQVVAGPWAEVGDRTLRSDIEVLAAYRLTPGLVTTWPVTWMQLASLGAIEPDRPLPAYVRQSLQRVRQRADARTRLRRLNYAVELGATNQPSLVREFGSSARAEIDGRVSAEYLWASTAARLSIGYQAEDDVTLDDSYLAQRVGNVVAYAGYLDHWWGPGWDGSLILSNNARPFPKIGFMRLKPNAFELPILRHIGPWQFNGFVGMLEEDGRQGPNTPLVTGMRLAINPLPGLEIGASRTLTICGSGRPCGISTWFDALTGSDNDVDADDPSNQLAGIDIRYTARLGAHHATVYYQTIGEDEADLLPSKRAGLIGLSIGGPLKDQGAQWRLTGEFADTTASSAIGLGESDPQPDIFYNHTIYTAGYRYRRRALGHSLDGDSRLYSLSASLTDLKNRTYQLRYHRAEINRDGGGGQEVSGSAEDINQLEAGVIVPIDIGTFEGQVRLQDDRPDTPGKTDPDIAAELRWLYRF